MLHDCQVASWAVSTSVCSERNTVWDGAHPIAWPESCERMLGIPVRMAVKGPNSLPQVAPILLSQWLRSTWGGLAGRQPTLQPVFFYFLSYCVPGFWFHRETGIQELAKGISGKLSSVWGTKDPCTFWKGFKHCMHQMQASWAGLFCCWGHLEGCARGVLQCDCLWAVAGTSTACTGWLEGDMGAVFWFCFSCLL